MSWVPCSGLGCRDSCGQSANVDGQKNKPGKLGVAADGAADKVGERQGEGSVLAEGRTLSVPEGHGTEPRRPWNRTEGNVLSPGW